MKKQILIFFLISLTLCVVEKQEASPEESLKVQPKNNVIWPEPKIYISTPNAKPYKTSPCGMKFTIQAVPTTPVVREMIDFYLKQVFNCPAKPKSNNVEVIVAVKNTTIMTPS